MPFNASFPPELVGCGMALPHHSGQYLSMKIKGQVKSRQRTRHQNQPLLEVEAIPAPTLYWHPSIPLEKLISDFSEYQDSIIVS
jgi:hypothetical protein